MKKFVVIINENGKIHICIEIVSDATLKHSDGKDYASVDEYLKNVYGERHLVSWHELDADSPADIRIFKEGVFMTPTDQAERDADYIVRYI